MSLVAVSIRMSISAVIRPEWPFLFLLRNVHILLPVLPLAFPMFIRFLYALQNAKILALFQVEQSQRTKTEEEQALRLMSSPGSPNPNDDDGDDKEAEETINKVLPVREIPISILLSYTQKLFFATDYTIPQMSMFDQLGDVTAIVCLDRLSLSTKDPHVGKTLFFHGNEPTTLDLKRTPGLPGEIEFSVSGSIEEYLAALKPLGLNCMLMADGMGTGKEYDGALQGLARAIGFKNSIVESFTPLREIEISKSKDGSRLMTSLVVREPRGGLQFFSRGDLKLILSNCQDYWDGTGIKPLTDDIRKSIIDTYGIWSTGQGYVCVGMAYKAVKPSYNYLFEQGRKRSQSGNSEVRSRSGSVASAGRKRQVSKSAEDAGDQAIAENQSTVEDKRSGRNKKRQNKRKSSSSSSDRSSSSQVDSSEDDEAMNGEDSRLNGKNEKRSNGVVDEQSAFSTEVDSSWIEDDRMSALGSRTPRRGVNSFPPNSARKNKRNDETDQESDMTDITRDQRQTDESDGGSEAPVPVVNAKNSKKSKRGDSPSGSEESEEERERIAPKQSPKKNRKKEEDSDTEDEDSAEESAEEDEGEGQEENAASSSASENETAEDRDKRRLSKIREHQIFIGMVAITHDPKRTMPGFVDTLNSSFIRFIYLSEQAEGPTKTFGGRLGLETDWNSIITLKDPLPGDNKKEITDPKKPKIQKLPVGISCIQKHIDEVDNVPLLVRLFCDATPETKAQLIEILQSNGEMVFSFGQATNPQHYLSQVQSDFSMGMLPYIDSNNSENHDSFHSDDESFTEEEKPHMIIDVDEFLEAKAARSKTLMSHLLQLSSTLISEDHHFIQTSLELLKMGRYLLQNAQMSLWFLFGASLALQVHQTLTAVFLVSASLDAIMLLWLIVIIIPLIAGSLLSTPPQPKLMKIISDKNVPIPSKKVVRIALYFAARALPSAVASLAVFVLSMRSLWTAGGIPEVFGVVEPSDLTAFGQKQFQDALVFSQNLCLFTLVLCLSSFSVTSSMAFHSRTRSIFKFNPFKNTEWVVACVVAVVLQVVFLLIYLRDILSLFAQIDWFIYVIIFVWPLVVIVIDVAVKGRERSHWKLNQEMLRLEFETKLGMHSPI